MYDEQFKKIVFFGIGILLIVSLVLVKGSFLLKEGGIHRNTVDEGYSTILETELYNNRALEIYYNDRKLKVSNYYNDGVRFFTKIEFSPESNVKLIDLRLKDNDTGKLYAFSSFKLIEIEDGIHTAVGIIEKFN